MVGLERHQGPARPVVEQVIDGERGDQLGLQGAFEMLSGQPDGVAGIREPLQRMDEYRRAAVGRRQLRRRDLQLVHPVAVLVVPGLVGHGYASSLPWLDNAVTATLVPGSRPDSLWATPGTG